MMKKKTMMKRTTIPMKSENPSVDPIKPRTVRYANPNRSAIEQLNYLIFTPPSQLILLETRQYHYPQTHPDSIYNAYWLLRAAFINRNDQPCTYSLYELPYHRYARWQALWNSIWQKRTKEPILMYQTPEQILWIPQSAIQIYHLFKTPYTSYYILYLAKGKLRLNTEIALMEIPHYSELIEPLEQFLMKQSDQHLKITLFTQSDTFYCYANESVDQMGQTENQTGTGTMSDTTRRNNPKNKPTNTHQHS